MKVVSVIFSIVLTVLIVWFVIDSITVIVKKLRAKHKANLEKKNDNNVIDTKDTDK